MSTKTIAGTPNDPNQDLAIQTDQDCTLDDAMRAVHVTSAGTTVKLPPNPKVDQTHRIVATDGAVTVDGNGHAVVGGGGTVPNDSTIEYTFSVANEWVPETGAGEVPVTRMIIAGPGLLGGGSLAADVTLSADLANVTPANVTKSPAVIGTSTQEARADHKHDVSTAVPVAVGLVNAEGVATTLSRSDHVHAAGPSSSISYSNQRLTDFTTSAIQPAFVDVCTLTFTNTKPVIKYSGYISGHMDVADSTLLVQIFDSAIGAAVAVSGTFGAVSDQINQALVARRAGQASVPRTISLKVALVTGDTGTFLCPAASGNAATNGAQLVVEESDA